MFDYLKADIRRSSLYTELDIQTSTAAVFINANVLQSMFIEILNSVCDSL